MRSTSKSQRSQVSEMVKSMVHGKPSRDPKSLHYDIYDIFTWVETEPDTNEEEKVSEQGPLELQNNVNVPKNNENEEENKVNANETQIHQEEDENFFCTKKKTLKPYEIKNELYCYDPVTLKRSLSEEPLSSPKAPKVKIFAREEKKLDENNENDREVIKKRKEKIKSYLQFTRELPNSAFTSYYGKPAFEAYGRCSGDTALKTHNVNPHRGDNRPHEAQTYESAIDHAKNVRIEEHLPRKPVEVAGFSGKKIKSHSVLVKHLPLEKPDLINHPRFAEPVESKGNKEAVPSYQSLLKSQSVKKNCQKKQKNPKKTNKFLLESDGLKFLNTRDNLLQLIEEKKNKDKRIAYKVTECYPGETKAFTESRLDYNRPAGLEIRKGDTVDEIFYPSRK